MPSQIIVALFLVAFSSAAQASLLAKLLCMVSFGTKNYTYYEAQRERLQDKKAAPIMRNVARLSPDWTFTGQYSAPEDFANYAREAIALHLNREDISPVKAMIDLGGSGELTFALMNKLTTTFRNVSISWNTQDFSVSHKRRGSTAEILISPEVLALDRPQWALATRLAHEITHMFLDTESAINALLKQNGITLESFIEAFIALCASEELQATMAEFPIIDQLKTRGISDAHVYASPSALRLYLALQDDPALTEAQQINLTASPFHRQRWASHAEQIWKHQHLR